MRLATVEGKLHSEGPMKNARFVLLASVALTACTVEARIASELGDHDAGAPQPDSGVVAGWTPFSDGLSGAQVVDLRFDPRAATSTLYATAANAIYVSTDAGNTWQTRGTFADGSIGYLATPGTDPTLLLASSSAGIIQSKDAGKTWSVISLEGLDTSYVVGSIAEPLRAYASVPAAGVFRSDDGGESWFAVNEGIPYADTLALDVAPDTPDDALAGGAALTAASDWAWSDGTEHGFVVRTTDGGHTWTTTLQDAGIVWVLRRCLTDPSIVYAATNSGVARSQDRGATWALTPLPNGYVTSVAVNPSDCDDVYAVESASPGPRHSTDGGQTFGPVLAQGLDALGLGSLAPVAVDPSNANSLILGTYEGVFVSATTGAQWTLAQGLLGLSIRSLNASPVDPGELWLASWDQGVWHRPSAEQPWQKIPLSSIPNPAAFAVAADPYTAGRVLVGSGTVYQSNDDGATFTASGALSEENLLAIGFDPTNPSILYATSQLNGVFKSTDGGITWSASNGGLTRWDAGVGYPVIDVSSIAIDPASPQTLYIGTNGGGIYKSVDGAESWTSVYAATSSTQPIYCMLAVPTSPTTIYACVGGAGVMQTVDGGATWTDVNQGLPSLDISGLVVDQATGFFYATTASSPAGVYVKRGSAAWTGFDIAELDGAGAPAIVVEGTIRRLVVASSGGVVAHVL
jgi:photosystem II stability/assembly factor-like uncharacterized protein